MAVYKDKVLNDLWEIATFKATFCPIDETRGIHVCYYPRFLRIVELKIYPTSTQVLFSNNLSKFENELWDEFTSKRRYLKRVNWSKQTSVKGIMPGTVGMTLVLRGHGVSLNEHGCIQPRVVEYTTSQERPIAITDATVTNVNLQLEDTTALMNMERMEDSASECTN